MSVCRDCGAYIEWVETPDGKHLPVDPDYISYEDAEHEDILVTDSGNRIVVDITKRMPNIRGRLLHFQTCEEAEPKEISLLDDLD